MCHLYLVLVQESCDNTDMTGHMGETQASMLLDFRASNVLSFRDEMHLSLLATRMAEPGVARSVTWRDGGSPLDVLPVAGLFGANASGKSNVLKAMDRMRSMVLHSFRLGNPTGGIPRQPFLLGDATNVPTTFEVELVLDGIRTVYGFVFGDGAVTEEWAYQFPRGRASLIFRREGDVVESGSVSKTRARTVSSLLRPNALFLSTAASANVESLLPLYAWFGRNLRLAEAGSRQHRQALTAQMVGDEQRKELVLSLLRAADLGITDVQRRPIDPAMTEKFRRVVRILAGEEGELEDSEDGPSFEELGVRLVHRGADGDIVFDESDESLGTMVWVGLIGPVVEALADGAVLLADELDASLHPSLVAHLVRLFQSPATNPKRAQLIFNSHDPTLLGDSVGDRVIGRDQVWFTEKLSDGSSRLYPLADMDPRREEAIGRRYLAGRYGAVPILSQGEFAAAAELISASSDN